MHAFSWMHRIKPNIFHLNISGETIKDPERSNDFFVDHTAVFVVFLFLTLKFI